MEFIKLYYVYSILKEELNDGKNHHHKRRGGMYNKNELQLQVDAVKKALRLESSIIADQIIDGKWKRPESD